MTRVLVLLLATTAIACAQARQPAGGPPVEHPPRVVEVSPEPFAYVTRLDRPVIIRFDERISERLEGVREWADAVIVSPETGAVRVSRGRRHVEVSLEGGWQPDLVYRVVLLPVLRDLFNNVVEEPVELVFSTGAPIPETALAGFVEDRLTGRSMDGVRIEATHGDDGHTYVALTDTAGFFALRHVPAGAYDLKGWVDQNRNRVADFSEPQDSARFALADGDTVVVELQLLPRDTTPARLLRAEPMDSIMVELGFDDYFEPGPMDGNAAVYRLADSTFVADGTLFHATKLDSLREAEREAARAAADTLPAAAEQDTAVAELPDPPPPVRREDRQEPRRPAPPDRPRLPSRELILVLPEPLEPETRYYVQVSDVTNIHGVSGGGGTAAFRTPQAPRPEETVPPPDEATPPPDDATPPGEARSP